MRRVIIMLSIVAVLIPSISLGQDWSVPTDPPWPASQHVLPVWTDAPESALGESLVQHYSDERPDWLEAQTGASGFSGLLVRGQSDEDSSGEGGDAGDEGGDLSSQSNDPTSSLIQFTMQNFFVTDSYGGTGHGYQFNLLPVIPIQKSVFGFDRMINRPSIPIFGPTVDPIGPVDSKSGLGDIFDTHLFVKSTSWGGTWGVGTAINFPTATDPALGSREWQLGPSAVYTNTSQNKKWLYGGLVLAPFSLDSKAKSISFQPILVRFLPDDWYVSNGFQVWNWQTSNGNFAMPLVFKVGRVFKQVKPHPVNISAQASYTPDDWHQGPAPKWQFLLQVSVLIPEG